MQQSGQYPPHTMMVKLQQERELEVGMAISKILTRKCLPYDQSVPLRTIVYIHKLGLKVCAEIVAL